MQSLDTEGHRIYVPTSFDHEAHDILLHGLLLVQSKLPAIRGSKIGARPFYFEYILPLTKQNANRFCLAGLTGKTDDIKIKNVFQDVGSDAKVLQRFLNNEIKPTDGNKLFYKTVYCYLTIYNPKYTEIIKPNTSFENIGAQLGEFLRDPASRQDRMALAISQQKLLGIYKYANKNATGLHTGNSRYLAFLTASTIDYLFLLDFKYEDDKIKISHREVLEDEDLNLYFGFCIPGHDFSPIVMKSWRIGERASGLIYATNFLLTNSADLPSSLRMDFLTTDRYKLWENDFIDGQHQSIFASARVVLNGPRISVNIQKLDNDKIVSYLRGRIDSFLRRNIR